MTRPELEAAYQFCQQLAQSHYENFPVASLLLPKRLRRPISVIYAFARTADDFADEGNEAADLRLQKLNDYSIDLNTIRQHSYLGDHPIFIALSAVIHQFNLPIDLFDDLITAFKQDVVKSRYANFNEVLDYCRYSANPVGRLLLYLQGQPSQQQLEQSDAVCTALQLINFYQDIEQDYREQDRIYLPLDELSSAGIAEANIVQQNTNHIAPLLRNLYRRTAGFMRNGYPLGLSLQGRLGWEVRAMILGGILTLAKLNKQSDQQLLSRPRLNKWQLFRIILNSAHKRRYQRIAMRLLAEMHSSP